MKTTYDVRGVWLSDRERRVFRPSFRTLSRWISGFLCAAIPLLGGCENKGDLEIRDIPPEVRAKLRETESPAKDAETDEAEEAPAQVGPGGAETPVEETDGAVGSESPVSPMTVAPSTADTTDESAAAVRRERARRRLAELGLRPGPPGPKPTDSVPPASLTAGTEADVKSTDSVTTTGPAATSAPASDGERGEDDE
ncbi:MAG: hypothetical protein Q4C47_04095, partial [Planctomycetia bacterium]|nr:hypothetical protein [Planctomycetia bacterium]